MSAPSDSILTRFHLPGSAQHLALIRVVVVLRVMVVLASPSLPLSARLLHEPRPGIRSVVPGFAVEWLAQPAHLDFVVSLGLVAGGFALLGLFTRPALAVLSAIFLCTQDLFFRASYFHDDWLYFNFDLLVLTLAPCAEAWSIDHLLRRAPAPLPATRYRWPVEAMGAWFAMLYLAAGLSKITPLRKGFIWLTGVRVRQFAIEFVWDSPLYWLTGHAPFNYDLRWPFALAAVLTVVVELSAALLLVSRRYHAPVIVAILCVHVGIALFGLPGFAEIALVSAALFLRPESFPDMKGASREPRATPAAVEVP